jgi:hypothetical protein
MNIISEQTWQTTITLLKKHHRLSSIIDHRRRMKSKPWPENAIKRSTHQLALWVNDIRLLFVAPRHFSFDELVAACCSLLLFTLFTKRSVGPLLFTFNV